MSEPRFRERNNNWKGGRLKASNGYILVRVGIAHHLADVRGYAYEHRLIAEEKLQRRLNKGEMIHHVDGNKENNAAENIVICSSIAEHRLNHRKKDSVRRLPNEPNLPVTCKCGCGTTLPKYDKYGRKREYVSGHNLKH